MLKLLIAVVAVTSLVVAGSDEWKTATVVYAKLKLSSDTNVAAQGSSGIIQTAHEQFDLEAGDVTYTVEQWVVPQQMLRLRDGAPVQLNVNGKSVVVKTADGKTRRMKLLASHPTKP